MASAKMEAVNCFTWLPKDVLRLFVARYVHPLDYHRVLRCGRLFHVLTDEERYKKEFERKVAIRRSCKRHVHKYTKICDTCDHTAGKTKKGRIRHFAWCERYCKDRREEFLAAEYDHYVDHMKGLDVYCPFCEVEGTFFFPTQGNHRYEQMSCGFGIVFEHKYRRFTQRWLAQLRNKKRKEDERKTSVLVVAK